MSSLFAHSEIFEKPIPEEHKQKENRVRSKKPGSALFPCNISAWKKEQPRWRDLRS